jgi:hypothetical protein
LPRSETVVGAPAILRFAARAGAGVELYPADAAETRRVLCCARADTAAHAREAARESGGHAPAAPAAAAPAVRAAHASTAHAAHAAAAAQRLQRLPQSRSACADAAPAFAGTHARTHTRDSS